MTMVTGVLSASLGSSRPAIVAGAGALSGARAEWLYRQNARPAHSCSARLSAMFGRGRGRGGRGAPMGAVLRDDEGNVLATAATGPPPLFPVRCAHRCSGGAARPPADAALRVPSRRASRGYRRCQSWTAQRRSYSSESGCWSAPGAPRRTTSPSPRPKQARGRGASPRRVACAGRLLRSAAARRMRTEPCAQRCRLSHRTRTTTPLMWHAAAGRRGGGRRD